MKLSCTLQTLTHVTCTVLGADSVAFATKETFFTPVWYILSLLLQYVFSLVSQLRLFFTLNNPVYLFFES